MLVLDAASDGCDQVLTLGNSLAVAASVKTDVETWSLG
ncbi:hypothetical protein SynBIOSU31_00690 [Synechococcus sp. BIOS-U3-1]|nr:hypothetical protein SynBIOSU31_00690 [Synechococcus sp. BIOS-U3-1]